MKKIVLLNLIFFSGAFGMDKKDNNRLNLGGSSSLFGSLGGYLTPQKPESEFPENYDESTCRLELEQLTHAMEMLKHIDTIKDTVCCNKCFQIQSNNTTSQFCSQCSKILEKKDNMKNYLIQVLYKKRRALNWEKK